MNKQKVLLTAVFIATAFTTFYGLPTAEAETWAKALPPAEATPTENECRPYIEKAIKQLTTDGSKESTEDTADTTKPDCNESGSETTESSDTSNTDDTNNEEIVEDTIDDIAVVTDEEPNTENADEELKNVEKEENTENTNEGTENENNGNIENEKISEENSTDNQESKETQSDDETAKQSDETPEDNQEIKILENVKDNEVEDEINEDNSKEVVKMKKFIPRRRKRQIEKTIKDTKKSKNVNNDDNNSAEEQDEEDSNSKQRPKDEEDASEEENEEFDMPEEELTKNDVIPSKLRNRDHVTKILQLEDEDENEHKEKMKKLVEITLKELKKLYDNAIKPLELLYKYRDLSNRHFGDAEIFSKPLILFMGPWSGGKSTLINYLLDNEFSDTALRTGAEPSPAYFNILMHGENETILDGTQLAADGTFSGLQKFGQGLLDRLKGLQIPHPLLQKANIVEIPGILEIRKQVERVFPFNDACQWFIDRADLIFLVYDPSKLDVGPETEAILDQLKGREYQTRIILNKADQVKAEELMRVQGTLIWNISPLMSSVEPPIMYTTSLWSIPYEKGSPSRLLYSQEINFLKDLRSAIDKRVENKIASARRFAVRVRNHAKMVDCYLTTYYNHKSIFGNRKKINDDIIDHPQNYHIYEGLSTLTNISRYDLPDPDVYKDFFRLHPIYEFQRLSDTCTYFRGCPINKLDIAIAYELPDLVGKYKRQIESILNNEWEMPKTSKKIP